MARPEYVTAAMVEKMAAMVEKMGAMGVDVCGGDIVDLRWDLKKLGAMVIW